MNGIDQQLGPILFTVSADAIFIARPADGRLLQANPAALKLISGDLGMVRSVTLAQLLDAEVGNTLAKLLREPVAVSAPIIERARLKTARGNRVPVAVTLTPFAGPEELLWLVHLRIETIRDWNERRQHRHRDILEQIATGKPLLSILEAIVDYVEHDAPEIRCSILLLDEAQQRFLRGAAPRLPAFYTEAVQQLDVGPELGTCGPAACIGQRVVTEDIEVDPNWAPFRPLARQAGLRSCWSEPIKDAAGTVLGTFAIYHAEPHTPTERELEAVALTTHLASIAIARAKALESMQQSQQMMRMVLDNIPQGVFWKDRNSQYLGCNRVVAQAFGYESPEQIIGVRDTQLAGLTPEHAAFFVQKDREIMDADRPEYGIIEPATLADGSKIIMETCKIPIHDAHGKVVGILGTWQDITQRQQAEEAVRASEAKLSAIARTLPQALYVYDIVEQKNVYFNREIWHDLGYSKAEMDEMGPLFMQRLLHPDDLARMPALIARWEHASDTDVLEVEYRMRHHSGEWRWFHARDSVYQRTPDGRVRQVVGTAQDITARKLDTELLARSERQYRDLVETSQDLIWSVDREGRWTFVNRHGAGATYGYEPEEMLGRPFLDFVPPEQAIHDRVVFAKLLQGESVFHYQTTHQRKDGTAIILRYNAVPLYDEARQIIGTTGTATDITERIHAEEALRQSERHLRTILETEPECVNLLNEAGELIDMNPAGLAMLGATSLAQIQGKCIYSLVHADYQTAHQQLVREVFAGRAQSLEFPITTLTGRECWMDTRAVPLTNDAGKVTALLSVTRDVTARKRTEEEVRQSKSLLEGVSRLQREFLVGTSPSESFDRMMNYLLATSGSQYGFIAELRTASDGHSYLKTFAVTNLAWDEPSRAFYAQHAADGLVFHNLNTLFGETIKSRQVVFANDPPNDPRRGGLPPGHPPLHAFLGLPLFHGDELLGMVGLANRTGGYGQHHVLQLEPIVSTCASLVYAYRLDRERALADEQRRLLEAKMQQTQKLESLGILAGGIAHDFNNLLTSILGYSDLALLELPAESTARLLIEEAVNGTRRAAELTKQMLAYSGKGHFVIEPLNLTQLTEETARLLNVSISKKCTLVYNLTKDLPAIEADAVQIRQILMNLIINASEAIGDQQGTITLTTGVMHADRAYLSETYLDDDLPDGLYVFVEVTDTGMGMTPETRAKIFDPFFTTKFTGRGLGLSAVLGIVRGHRGAIKCHSERGQGTTFRVLLPASPESIVHETSHEEASKQWIGQGKVLVVDDEDSVLALSKQMLERMGFSVQTASDGREALACYIDAAKEYRLVLLDMTMPHMNGEETFLAMKQRDPQACVILTSGYHEQSVTARLQELGLAGFISKPYTYEQLQTAVKKVLLPSGSKH